MMTQNQQTQLWNSQVIKQVFFKSEEYKLLLAAVKHGFVNNKWNQDYLLSKTKTGFVRKGKMKTNKKSCF